MLTQTRNEGNDECICFDEQRIFLKVIGQAVFVQILLCILRPTAYIYQLIQGGDSRFSKNKNLAPEESTMRHACPCCPYH